MLLLYGEELGTSTANHQVKFATYTRDGSTGLDYADQRYYTNLIGMFLTPDPSAASAKRDNPGRWNRYSYVGGDPTNSNDPSGLDQLERFTYVADTGVYDSGGLSGGGILRFLWT